MVAGALLNTGLSVARLHCTNCFVNVFDILIFVMAMSCFLCRRCPCVAGGRRVIVSSFVLTVTALSLSKVVVRCGR